VSPMRVRWCELQKALSPSICTRERLLRIRLATRQTRARVRVPHATLLVDLNDCEVGRHLYRERTYRPAESAALERLTPSGVVLEIGANLGYFTTLFAKRATHVHAIEPSPCSVSLLRANTSGLPNVTVWPGAVGEQAGSAVMYLAPQDTERADYPSLHDRRVPVAIRMVTGETLASRVSHVDFFRIDFEGFEVQVLRGLRHVLTANPKAPIAITFWPAGLAAARSTIQEFLDAIGPAAFHSLGPDGRELPLSSKWFTCQHPDHCQTLIAYRR
jgi:FkbM family methyltransferase